MEPCDKQRDSLVKKFSRWSPENRMLLEYIQDSSGMPTDITHLVTQHLLEPTVIRTPLLYAKNAYAEGIADHIDPEDPISWEVSKGYVDGKGQKEGLWISTYEGVYSGGYGYENNYPKREYYRKGLLHRENGPAVSTPDEKSWYIRGKFHREDGPAKIVRVRDWPWLAPTKLIHEWFTDGILQPVTPFEVD